MLESDPEAASVADTIPPLLEHKPHGERSVFTAANLLREARRQRQLPDVAVPAVCILDPDGDLTRYLQETGNAHADPAWACYHTTLQRFKLADSEVGIIPFTVGAPFAVLVAEELMASGCKLLINLTSAGRIAAPAGVASFVVIERALRDEGTSLHYLPPARWSHLHAGLREALANLDVPDARPVLHGSTWTTDAPFRETARDIERHRAAGVLGVEMEAAALYAFAEATGHNVFCLAHLTNELGSEGDFEKAPPTAPKTPSAYSKQCSADWTTAHRAGRRTGAAVTLSASAPAMWDRPIGCHARSGVPHDTGRSPRA